MSDLFNALEVRRQKHASNARGSFWASLHGCLHDAFSERPAPVFPGMDWNDHLTASDFVALRAYLAPEWSTIRAPACWEVLLMAQLTCPMPSSAWSEDEIVTYEQRFSARRTRVLAALWNGGTVRREGVEAVAATFLLTEVGVDRLGPAEHIVSALLRVKRRP